MSVDRLRELLGKRVDLDYIERIEARNDQIVPYVRLTVEARDLWVEWTRDLLCAADILLEVADELANLLVHIPNRSPYRHYKESAYAALARLDAHPENGET